MRLFRRAEARFTGGRVHEKLEIAGQHPLLPGELHHFTYADAADRAKRCATYAALWAESAREAGRRTWPGIGISHAALRFVRGYVLKGGFLDGAAGFDVALGNAREVWLKYQLLRAIGAPRRRLRPGNDAKIRRAETGHAEPLAFPAMTAPRNSKRSAAVVGLAVMGSRLMGVIREQVFAFMFGASKLADAFFAAFRIPNLLRDLFAEGALSTAFTTTFTKTWDEGGPRSPRGTSRSSSSPRSPSFSASSASSASRSRRWIVDLVGGRLSTATRGQFELTVR